MNEMKLDFRSMAGKKDKIVIVSIIISVFLFLFLTKTITSGYHFVDDHEVIKMKSDLSSLSLIDGAKKWVQEDLVSNSRFRPVYYIHRVIETELFGSDFFLWSLYTGILCCVTFIFFYLGIRNLKFSPAESIVFLIITFIGPQSSIWWRLGPAETLGMFWLGLSFYFMSACLSGKHYYLNTLFFVFFLILSSLTKESFLIIIPAMIFLKVWNEKNQIWYSLRKSVIRNLLLIILLIVLALELYFIISYIGTSYSGLDSNIINSLKSYLSTFLRFLRTYLNLIITGLIVLIINFKTKRLVSKTDYFPIVLFLAILIPGIVLFARSGLVERYLLPTSFGLAFLAASYFKGIEENTWRYKKIILALVIISFIPAMVKSSADAIKFSNEGHETKTLLTAIANNYKEGNATLVIADPVQEYERSVSLKTFLYYENKIDLFGYAIIKEGDESKYPDYIGGWKSYFEGKQLENMTEKPALIIFLDNRMINEFFNRSDLSQDDYPAIGIGKSHYALLKEKQ
jgi:hypothetical protein